MSNFWRKHRALVTLGTHERWRVHMGCPGVPRETLPFCDPSVPRRGEIYCRCERCHQARATLGWPSLSGE